MCIRDSSTSGIIGGSLADGSYTLTIDATKIQVGSEAMANDHRDDFFRKFGDATGDNVVNVFDFLQFRRAFGSAGTYDDTFDYNGDGNVNIFDFLQFRSRFGT